MMDEKVMVVDDDPSICYTVKVVFAAAGVPVVAVDSGHACLESLHKGFRGVILLDIMMPGMDGWDTLREIRDTGLIQGNIICMLTAVANPDERMEGLKEYVLDYIRKPFDPRSLLEVTSEFLTYLEPVA